MRDMSHMTEVGVHEFGALKQILSIVALGMAAQPLIRPSGNDRSRS